MKSNFHSNQILYVKGIGYARLIIEGQKNSNVNGTVKIVQNNNSNAPIVQQNDQVQDSVLFDPDMFRIDSDSPFGESQVQTNIAEQSIRKKSIQVSRKSSLDVKNRQLIIVPLKLQQTNAMIYCPEAHLMKKITIQVKSLLQNNRKQIHIAIQITKTIDNLRNQIFKQLGQEIGFYSDIRIFTTVPRLEDLNIGSKTVWQYQLKDKCKITIAARFNFTFKNLVKGEQDKFVLSNGNNTIANFVPVPKKQQPSTNTSPVVAANTVPIVASETIKLAEGQVNKAQKVQILSTSIQEAVKQVQKKSEQVLAEGQKEKQRQTPVVKRIQDRIMHLQCNPKFRSGIHYWQIKIDRVNVLQQEGSLTIGVCLKSQQQSNTSDFVHLWCYDVIRGKKVQTLNPSQKSMTVSQKQQQQVNWSDQSDEQYGSVAKNGDLVGVLLSIKQKKASLVFYKNSVCLQECYEFSVSKLKSKQFRESLYLCPFVKLSGQVQLSLDSKAVAPLDSYRFK